MLDSGVDLTPLGMSAWDDVSTTGSSRAVWAGTDPVDELGASYQFESMLAEQRQMAAFNSRVDAAPMPANGQSYERPVVSAVPASFFDPIVATPLQSGRHYDYGNGYNYPMRYDFFADKNKFSDSIATFASSASAILDGFESLFTGVGKGEANYYLNRMAPVWNGKIADINAAKSLADAQAVVKSSTAKSSVAMAKYAGIVKASVVLAPIAGGVDLGVKLYADPSKETFAAWGVTTVGGVGAAWAGAQIGGGLATIIGIAAPPILPIALPVGVGLGAGVGYLTYEFGGFSDSLFDNSKKWLKDF